MTFRPLGAVLIAATVAGGSIVAAISAPNEDLMVGLAAACVAGLGVIGVTAAQRRRGGDETPSSVAPADDLVQEQHRHEVCRHALVREHARLVAALDSGQAGLIVSTRQEKVVFANERAGRWLGFDEHLATGASIESLLRDERLRRNIRQAMTEASPSSVVTRLHAPRRIGPKDETQLFEVRTVPFGSGEDVLFATWVQERPGAADPVPMDDRLAQIAHEFRSPLAALQGTIEMLFDHDIDDGEDRARCLRALLDETARMTRVVDNVLALGRLEAGRTAPNLRFVDLVRLIEHAAAMLRPLAQSKSIELRVHTDRLHDAMVWGDADLLLSVLSNLVSNAVKYTPPHGRVDVSLTLSPMNGTVTVAVTDTGVGIGPEALPHVYERYYRSADTRDLASGTGLGLALCKQIVESVHGGRVGVTSRRGSGSRFWFTIAQRSPSRRAA